MIPYPSPELLLREFGSHDEGRRKARAEIERAMVERAKAEAERAGRSLNCESGNHRDVYQGVRVGCRNDGSTCICECHDTIQPAKEASR